MRYRTRYQSKLVLVCLLIVAVVAPIHSATTATSLASTRLDLSSSEFIVNNPNDADDAVLGDGSCDADPNPSVKQCTLRAAIQEANTSTRFNYVRLPAGVYILTRGSLLVDANLILTGAGVALTIIDGNHTDRVLSMPFGYKNTVDISDVTIQNGTAPSSFLAPISFGGGIYNTGRMSITGSIIVGNAACWGGGIYNSGSLSLDQSSVRSNFACGSGGGVTNVNVLSLNYSTVSENTVNDSNLTGNISCKGGGITSSGSLSLINSTISGNTVGGTAGVSCDGGGIYSFHDNIGEVKLSTISNNSASGSGGGLGTENGSMLHLGNTILAGNTNETAPDCAGNVPSYGSNLVGIDVGCTFIRATGDRVGTRDQPIYPLLGPLQDNGGHTFTQALLPSSPAIDAGARFGCDLFDQRGVSRPQDRDCDTGAYEYEPPNIRPPLTQISTDPYTNDGGYHHTEVEPDTFAFGPTVVAAFQVGRFFRGGATNIGWATSTLDGPVAGFSWKNGLLPGITKSQGGSYDCVSDPSVAYDAKDSVWLISSLPITAKSCADPNDTVPSPAVLVSRSTDEGFTWSDRPVTIATAQPDQDFDKNWTVCDNTPSSPYYGHCYTEWDSSKIDRSDSRRILMSTSTDGGVNWQPALTTAQDQNGNVAHGVGGQPVVQPNGTVIVPFFDGGAIEVFTSTNGGKRWSNPAWVDAVLDHSVAGRLRTEPIPSAEVDGMGRVYVVWQDCGFRSSCTSNDIVMSTSTDATNWSMPIRIPIDATNSTVDHFIPGLAVDKATSGDTTHLALTYYYYPQAACDVHSCQLKVGFISSIDGGTHWSPQIDLAGPIPLPWLPYVGGDPPGYMVGDYISTSYTSAGVAHPVFAVAKAPIGGNDCSTSTSCDEAIYSPASGLSAAGGTVVASSSGRATTSMRQLITSSGGRIVAGDGSFQIDFPANAVVSPTTISFRRLGAPPQPLPLGGRMLRSFTLDANTTDGQPVTKFQRPYTMVISYTEQDLLALGVNDSSLRLAFWDRQQNGWVNVPSRIDTLHHSLTASLDHLTEFVLFGIKYLDDFNRPNGALGPSWSGRTDPKSYKIIDQQVHVHVGDRGVLYWQPEAFGPAQEAFVTLANIDTDNHPEPGRQGLLLKVQGDIPNILNGAIEVRYDANVRGVRVRSFEPGRGSRDIVAVLPVSFADGDQLGARALPDGKLQIYRNGILIGQADAGSFFANVGGRIGLRCIDVDNTVLDDFGGGDIEASVSAPPTIFDNRIYLPMIRH